MVLNDIEKLVEKYNNAETTLQEEAQLQNYFTGQNVAPHLAHYKPLFSFFTEAQNEVYTKDIPLKPRRNTRLYQWISVAAVAVVMLGIGIPQLLGPTEAEKQEALLAYNKAMDALSFISIGMNEGREQLGTLSLVSESFEAGKQGASRLNEFNKAKNKIFNNN